ncbi:MAG: hypothetical protein IKN12_01890 [Selenomonadaceae bacterium]|nr:hypothetical protein [Selenomonadaceae bacterium]
MKRYVYGAGFAGKVTAGYLTYCKGQKIDGLVVSDGHREATSYAFPQCIANASIPIIEYNSVKDEDAMFYMTVVKGKEEVMDILKQRSSTPPPTGRYFFSIR